MQRSALLRCIVSNCVVYAKKSLTPDGVGDFLMPVAENENEVRVWGAKGALPVADEAT